ncbi:MAG: palindromic element RPE1 domain-containing protein [Holosporales bacterium]|nr:palindromic element RPE1 domain-containing protein [Holosporales bacterium]
MEGDTERRTAAYLSVHEDSSTESTHQEAECGELRKNSIALFSQFLSLSIIHYSELLYSTFPSSELYR